MKIISFDQLECWQLSLKVTKLIYDASSNKLFDRDYFLKSQIRRAIVSVSSNIVEGFERTNNNEFIRFLKIAKGSCGEARNQLFIAKEICYINNTEFDSINTLLLDLSKQIGSFINYLEAKKKAKEFTNKIRNK